MNRSARLVTAALLVLGAGWAIAPRSALPLYDGIGFPDEPYRFVQRPAGAQETDPPTTAHGSAAVVDGTSEPLVAASAEVAPQISVFIPKGRFTVAPGTGRITVTGAPTQPLPTGRHQFLWSNVYDVRAAPSGSALKPPGQQATITLRAASAQRPQPHIAYYRDGRWVLLPTFAQGQDIYIAELVTFGQYAVVGNNPLLVTKVSTGNGGNGGTSTGLFVGIGAGVVIVVLFVLGWIRRTRAHPADPNENEEAPES